MKIVRIKDRRQITLPPEIMEELDLAVGDLLEAGVSRGRVVLKPKTVTDRETAGARGRAGGSSK